MKSLNKGFNLSNLVSRVLKSIKNLKHFYGTDGTFKDNKWDDLENINKGNKLFTDNTIRVEKDKTQHMFYYIKKLNKEDGTYNLIYINFTSKSRVWDFRLKKWIKTLEIKKNECYVTEEAIEIKAGNDIKNFIKDSSEIGWKGSLAKKEAIDEYLKLIEEKGGLWVNIENGQKVFYNIEELGKLDFFNYENFNEFVNIGNKVDDNINIKD